MHIRKATPQDDSILGELMIQSFVTAYAVKMPEVVVSDRRKAQLRDVAKMRSQCSLLVLEEEGRILGCAGVYKPGIPEGEAWDPGYGGMRFVSLAPETQGRGLGRTLVNACIETAREWKIQGLQIHVRRGAFGLIKFYESFGFKREARGDIDMGAEFYGEGYTLDF